MPWYENPQVWTAIVALLALFLGIRAQFTIWRLHSEAARQKLHADLQTITTQINDAFLKYNVDTPYQVTLGFKGDEKARGKIVLLILQLNLLGAVFTNISILTNKEIKDYTDWAQRILRPWIEHDPQIQAAYKHWISSGDGGEAYTNWLKATINIVPV